MIDDEAADERRMELRMEYAEELADERKRWTRCLCGYPDWPGRCPGAENCPVHGEEREIEE